MIATIVGAGLSGGVAATILRERGYDVEVFETRGHIGGNCHDHKFMGQVTVHSYGPHAFHTDKKWIWDWALRFSDFNLYELHVLGIVPSGDTIPIPFNLNSKKVFPEWGSQEIIDNIFVGYSEKMWGDKWENLPTHITNRVPKVRENYQNSYHLDPYQGLPKYGYTEWIRNMFDGCRVHLNCDPDAWKGRGGLVIYTGSIDSYFGYNKGILPYRSLRFETELTRKYSPSVQLNYCSSRFPYTRVIDHSHWYGEVLNQGFEFWEDKERRVKTKEFPEEFQLGRNDRFYPKRYGQGLEVYKEYQSLAKQEKHVIFLGRLGTYSYLDMDDCIAQVFSKLKDV